MTFIVCLEDHIQKTHVVTIFFPRGGGKDTEKLVTMVNVRNEIVSTKNWKVHGNKEEWRGQLMAIVTNHKSRGSIVE